MPRKKQPPAGGLAELRLQLAERERQLADLTEHSLQILDRLAEARATAGDQAALQARITELQEVLADTRQRVRLGACAVLQAGAAAAAVFEVVVWDVGSTEAVHLQAVADAAATPMTALLGPDLRADGCGPIGAGLTLLETECRTPAHSWNQAFAATQAPVIVLLAAGARPTAGALARLAAVAADAGVAVASPLLVHGDFRSLGRGEHAILELRAQPSAGGAVAVGVPFASPEAFAVSRRAFEQLGPFDQDLRGDLALAEWTMRAAARSLRCLGVADAEVAVAAPRSALIDGTVGEADRLIVMARHRPQQVAAAALASTGLWQQEPALVASMLAAAFRRLPHAAEFGGAVDLLVAQAQTVAAWKRTVPALRERLVGIANELGLAIADNLTEPALVTLAERMQAKAAALRERGAELELRQRESHELRAHVAAHEQVAREWQTQIAAHEQVERQWHTRVAAHAQVEQELRTDIVARASTIDTLRQELIQREQAIAALREELGHRTGDRDRLIDHLGAVQQEIERANEASVHAATECVEMRAQQQQADERAAAFTAELQTLRESLASVEARNRELERHVGEARGQLALRESDLLAKMAEASHLQQAFDAAMQRSALAIGEVEQLRPGHERLRRDYAALQEEAAALGTRVAGLEQALRDRERWVADLLREVQQRRLLRRELSPRELEFLARHPGNGRHGQLATRQP